KEIFLPASSVSNTLKFSNICRSLLRRSVILRAAGTFPLLAQNPTSAPGLLRLDWMLKTGSFPNRLLFCTHKRQKHHGWLRILPPFSSSLEITFSGPVSRLPHD